MACKPSSVEDQVRWDPSVEVKDSYITNLEIVDINENGAGTYANISITGLTFLSQNKTAIYCGKYDKKKNYNIFSIVSYRDRFFLSVKVIDRAQNTYCEENIVLSNNWVPIYKNRNVPDAYYTKWDDINKVNSLTTMQVVEYNNVFYKNTSYFVPESTPDKDRSRWAPVCFMNICASDYVINVGYFTVSHINAYTLYHNLFTNTTLSTDWIDTYAYVKNDVVFFENETYVCIEDISPGSFTSSGVATQETCVATYTTAACDTIPHSGDIDKILENSEQVPKADETPADSSNWKKVLIVPPSYIKISTLQKSDLYHEYMQKHRNKYGSDSDEGFHSYHLKYESNKDGGHNHPHRRHTHQHIHHNKCDSSSEEEEHKRHAPRHRHNKCDSSSDSSSSSSEEEEHKRHAPRHRHNKCDSSSDSSSSSSEEEEHKRHAPRHRHNKCDSDRIEHVDRSDDYSRNHHQKKHYKHDSSEDEKGYRHREYHYKH